MAVDHIVNFSCAPKEHFGNGDIDQGTATILEMRKAQSRAEYHAEQALKQGRNPEEMPVRVIVMGPDGANSETTATYSELKAGAAPLDREAHHCRGCSANHRLDSYGCFSALHYPITPQVEEWVMNRLQPIHFFGGQLCVDFLRDFGLTGTPVEQMRKSRLLFSSPRPITRVMSKSWFRKTTVNSNQIFQALISAGPRIDPGHCFGVLLWLGCINVDGEVPGDLSNQTPFAKLLELKSVEDRQNHTTFVGDPNPVSEEIAAMQAFLQGMYRSWVLNVEFFVLA